MTVAQHCLHGGTSGGYVHPLEEGCPPDGKAYYDALQHDLVKYGCATEKEAAEAREVLGDGGYEEYYFLRTNPSPSDHAEAMDDVKRTLASVFGR